MRILAISDVRKWQGYEQLVDRCTPDVVVLAGDLSSDGGAAFWHDAFEAIPAYRREKEAAFKRIGIIVVSSSSASGTHEQLRAARQIEGELKGKYQGTLAFTRARRRFHTKPFYDFLAYAGRRARVLVVKGDHDDDFPGEYSPWRINRIRGCREISGDLVTVKSTSFLGLGYAQARYRRQIKQLREQHMGAVNVIIAHTPHGNVHLVAALKPRLLIRGHFGSGRYLVDGVPTVFTSGEHAIIKLGRRRLPRVQMKGTHLEAFYRWEWDWLREYPS